MLSTDTSFPKQLALLKYEIELQFGMQINNAADCDLLSEYVFKSTNHIVSSQTFRRLFNLIKSKSLTSRATADILATYCGYSNLEQLFFAQLDFENEQEDKFQEAEIYKAFFEVEVPAIARGELNMVYEKAISGILKKVFNDKALYDALMPLIASNPTAHIYLFERFPYISGFGRGFASGYSLYLKHKQDVEAKVFGNALLFLAAVLSNEHAVAKLYYDNVCLINLATIRHPFAIARYLGTRLLYYHITGNEKCKLEMMDLIVDRLQASSNVNRHGFHSFNIEFELLIAEYLSLAGSFQLVIDILLPVYQQKALISVDMDRGFWLMPIKIMLIRAFSYTNRFEEALALMPLLGTLNWLVDDYFSIQLLNAKQRLGQDPADIAAINGELKRLIEKTRFRFFESLLKE
jgi:hypothetical protein